MLCDELERICTDGFELRLGGGSFRVSISGGILECCVVECRMTALVCAWICRQIDVRR